MTKEIDGVKVSEPVEDLVIDVPEEFQGVVIAMAGTRRGIMTKMVNHGSGRPRLKFRIPARGLDRIPVAVPHRQHQGHRNMNHLFAGWEPCGTARFLPRNRGALVADRIGWQPPRHLWLPTCRSAARSVEPATSVYGGCA